MEVDNGMEGDMCCRQDGRAGEMGHLPGEANQRPPANHKRMKMGDIAQPGGALMMVVTMHGN
jgi:hypothetical protein